MDAQPKLTLPVEYYSDRKWSYLQPFAVEYGGDRCMVVFKDDDKKSGLFYDAAERDKIHLDYHPVVKPAEFRQALRAAYEDGCSHIALNPIYSSGHATKLDIVEVMNEMNQLD